MVFFAFLLRLRNNVSAFGTPELCAKISWLIRSWKYEITEFQHPPLRCRCFRDLPRQDRDLRSQRADQLAHLEAVTDLPLGEDGHDRSLRLRGIQVRAPLHHGHERRDLVRAERAK